MPLVSGVCRAASAPMLSHGGSRLNASKPEANPKTSCPKTPKYLYNKTKNEDTIFALFFWSGSMLNRFQTGVLWTVLLETEKQRFCHFI